MTLVSVMLEFQHTGFYRAVLIYFAAYPIATSIMWITTAWLFRLRWEDAEEIAPVHPAAWPAVSVLVPAHNEEAVLRRALNSVLALDYPDFEVIVIDDGSTDGTADVRRIELRQ